MSKSLKQSAALMRKQLGSIDLSVVDEKLSDEELEARAGDVDIFEYTIKDDITKIIADISQYNPDVVGFSIYIWNISIYKKILSKLKDGRYVFCKEGVNFAVTKEQVESMLQLAEDFEAKRLKSRKI